MHKRWTRRRLPVLIFTIFIFLYLDFKLPTSSLPKLYVAQDPSPSAPHQRSIQQALSAAKDAQTLASGETHVTMEKRGHSDVTQPALKLDDIYIAVKTTGKFHKTRLALLLETWISRTKAHVSVF